MPFESGLAGWQLQNQVWAGIASARRAALAGQLDELDQARRPNVDRCDREREDAAAVRARNGGGLAGLTVADFPALKAQWSIRNGTDPSMITAGLDRSFWWSCPAGHPDWQAKPKDRARKGAACPRCRQRGTVNDVPALVGQLNTSARPDEVALGSNEPVCWVCRTWHADPRSRRWVPVEHRWLAPAHSRTTRPKPDKGLNGCPVCSGYAVDDTNSLATWFPELVAELDDPTIDPTTVTPGLHNARVGTSTSSAQLQVSWRCKHGHTWPSSIANRAVNGKWLPGVQRRRRLARASTPGCRTRGRSDWRVRSRTWRRSLRFG